MIARIIDKIGRMSPEFIRRILAKIPFDIRIGKKVYISFQEQIEVSKSWSDKDLESYVVQHFKKIFSQAKKFKLYENKYKDAGVYDLIINNLDDIRKIPILTKEEIRAHIADFGGYYQQNTGGTSGNPLPLYLDMHAWKREWAHYHSIWKSVNYHYRDGKFFFRGVNIKNKFIRYDFQFNSYVINIYKDPAKHLVEFFDTMVKQNIRFFQGYPSAINDFLKKIENDISEDQRYLLKSHIKYCLFSSEYPTPQIVNYIKNDWGFDFISCYGHSEICVLAASEVNNLEYTPYHTYGYVEVENSMLLGTSYHNTDMPLIRYNTGDLVEATRHSNGVVKSFQIKEGRVGDFIFDKKNMQISLTGMFFGRHHKIFNHINHVQIFQKEKGKATILVTYDKDKKLDVQSLMNLDGIDIDFDFLIINEPIRTQAGKVVLKVSELPDSNLNQTL